MLELERLVRQPVVDARFLAAWITAGGDRGLPRGTGTYADRQDLAAGMMQLAFAGGEVPLVDFEVRRYLGCYFVSF